MKAKNIIICALAFLTTSSTAFAGEFYKLHPQWLEYTYHILMLGLIVLGLGVSLSIFSNLKGGKLSRSWLIILAALLVILARTVLGILTVFDIQFFQAIAFAGLDILFFILLLVGLILYKVGLN